MAVARTTAQTTMGTGCTSHEGGSVTLSVPQSGYVLVQAQVRLYAQPEVVWDVEGFLVGIGMSPGDCAFDGWSWSGSHWWQEYGPAGAEFNKDLLQRAFSVSAGTHSFHLSGYVTRGGSNDRFLETILVAVFYPA